MIASIGKFARRIGVLAMTGVLLAGCDDPGPQVQGGTPDMRRLTQEQYGRIISDVFGSGIRVGGRIDPLIRTDGLLALGARDARITPTGFEQYYDLAHSIAAQDVDEGNRGELIPCEPASSTRLPTRHGPATSTSLPATPRAPSAPPPTSTSTLR